MGTLIFSIVASNALGFWYGSLCVEGKSCPSSSPYQPGDVLVVFFSILMSGFNLSQLTPSIKKIAEGRVAAERIFTVIDRKPLVRSIPNAFIPKDFRG